jgi:hypothetical protein
MIINNQEKSNKKDSAISNQTSNLQSMERRVKKLTTRLWAGIFLMFIILTAGIFALYYEQLALALSGDYDKGPGDTLYADDWNKLAEDFTALPSGVVVMWSGALGDRPDGWQLCDGSNGTPNLVNRFIAGAGGAYAVDATGGEDTVTLNWNQMPIHTHNVSIINNTGGGPQSYLYFEDGNGTVNTFTSTPAGSGLAHENRSLFYALYYICKL